MKKPASILLIVVLIVSSMVFSSCNSEETQKAAGFELEYVPIDLDSDAELSETSLDDYQFHYSFQEYRDAFMKAHDVEEGSPNGTPYDRSCICLIPGEASGEIEIPSKHDGRAVLAVVAKTPGSNDITSLTVGEGIKYIENCLDFTADNDSLKTISLPTSLIGIYHSFNYCSALTELEIPEGPEPLEGESAHISSSFSNCASLKTVTIRKKINEITCSFCDCPALTTLNNSDRFDSISFSFENCAALKETIVTGADVHDEKRKKSQELCEKALSKLAKSGAIPPLDEDGNPEFTLELDDNRRNDQMVFLDEGTAEKLLAQPKEKLDQVIVAAASADGVILAENGYDSRNFADTMADCRYLIYYDSYVSYTEENYYGRIKDLTLPDKGTIDRLDTTTVVMVIDAKTGNIVHLHCVGTDIPPKNTSSNRGGTLDTKACEYIKELLKY